MRTIAPVVSGSACIFSLVFGGTPMAIAQDNSEPQAAMPPKLRESVDIPFKHPSFTFVRVKYSSAHPYGGSAWSTDYPDADIHFTAQAGEVIAQ